MGRFAQLVREAFHDMQKLDGDVVEVYKNPTGQELMLLFKNSYDSGVRVGIDKRGDLYAWMEDYLHSDVSRRFNLKFALRFEYTKGRDTIFLSSGETKKNFIKSVNKRVLNRLKNTFPLVKKIETSTRPFESVYEYK